MVNPVKSSLVSDNGGCSQIKVNKNMHPLKL